MPRAATTTDAFNAVAEPRRREILDLLADQERSVNEIVSALGVAQPVVSKHLRVLKQVGLVDVREAGRARMYRLESAPLKEIHDWVNAFAGIWEARFEQLDVLLEQMQSADHGLDEGKSS
ncbi:MAG: winged helix-turn-helix transcriptional regulator [Actinobacteria bacterium]|nr:winged helix-turn-helix transcriptional regulator [Actinomycetota bacterium]